MIKYNVTHGTTEEIRDKVYARLKKVCGISTRKYFTKEQILQKAKQYAATFEDIKNQTTMLGLPNGQIISKKQAVSGKIPEKVISELPVLYPGLEIVNRFSLVAPNKYIFMPAGKFELELYGVMTANVKGLVANQEPVKDYPEFHIIEDTRTGKRDILTPKAVRQLAGKVLKADVSGLEINEILDLLEEKTPFEPLETFSYKTRPIRNKLSETGLTYEEMIPAYIASVPHLMLSEDKKLNEISEDIAKAKGAKLLTPEQALSLGFTLGEVTAETSGGCQFVVVDFEKLTVKAYTDLYDLENEYLAGATDFVMSTNLKNIKKNN